jgi:predicted site-specific integrase-resolvase
MAASLDFDTVGVEEAMQILGISRATVYRLKQRGELKPVTLPTRAKRMVRLRFRREDVERLSEPISHAS